jgi:DNA modification methylase
MITIACSNALHIPLRDKSVQCVVTSPPYWGLRDYGISDQIGLEATPAAYVAHIVAVMRECWRVLKDDGTLWLNLGDTFNSGGGTTRANGTGLRDNRPREKNYRETFDGLKPKDLCGIPWRVAFALQDDGWYLRSDIIWHKPNPMPESVTDRPTKAHEYVFLLTKQARYYYDAEAIKEPIADVSIDRAKYTFESSKRSRANSHIGDTSDYMIASQLVPESGMRNKRSVWTIATSPYSGKKDFRCTVCNGTGYPLISKMDMPPMTNEEWLAWCEAAEPCPACNGSGEQSTNVDHFATFPPALIEPMILAGTSARGECPHCGKAWVRVVERTNPRLTDENYSSKDATPKMMSGTDRNDYGTNKTGLAKPGWRELPSATSDTLGWRPKCDCPPHEPIPQTVLDPFAGSGTTGAVAVKHGRKAVLLDLNLKYIDLQGERTNGIQMVMPS